MKLRLTRVGAGALAVAAVATVVARWQGSRALALLVWAAVLAVGLAVASTSRRLGVTIDRSSIPRRLREGEALEVVLSVSAARRTTAVTIAETLPPGLGSSPSLSLESLAPESPVVHRYRLVPARRGAYTIGPATATVVDALGLSRRTEPVTGVVEVLVHPRTEPVLDRVLARRWEEPPIRPPRSLPWPTGLDLHGLRDYVPGDDLRRVVWPALARTGRLLVREAEQGMTDQMTVVVDVHPRRHRIGSDAVDTFEPSVRAAASLAVRGLGEGMAVSLVLGSSLVVDRARGGAARFSMLDALARAGLSDSPMGIIRPGQSRAPGAGEHLCVVATRLSEPDAAALGLAVAQGASVTFVAVTGEELDRVTVARAAAAGCEVVRLTVGAPLAEVFALQVGAGLRAGVR